MHFNKLKRWGAVLLAGVMAFSLAGCGDSGDEKKDQPVETSTTESASDDTDKDSPEYVDGDVTLPEDFDNMIYPLSALMVESYAKELPYYNEDSGEEEADSFWFSMAVLSSLMNNYVKDVTVDTDDKYIYLEEDVVNMYASALYDAYAQGNIEFPELEEDNAYAVYDDENETYGFLAGDIGTLEAVITDCEEDGGDYILTADLRDSDSGETSGSYSITITPTSYEGENNEFAYSVTDVQELDEDGERAPESTTEEFEENTEDLEEATTEETTEKDETPASDEDAISEDEALELAKEYFGEDAEYTYKGTTTLGDDEYYDFAVEGEDISSTDVLVSSSGEDVVGATENEDGSWSLSQ